VAFGGMAVAAVVNLTNNLYIILPVTVITAILILGRGQNAVIKGDAVIAMISVATLAFGYFLMNTFSLKGGNVSADVCSSLFGSVSILTLQDADFYVSLGMSVFVIAFFVVFYNKIFAVTFDSNFMKASGSPSKMYELLLAAVIGIVIALSMRLVGSLLISALIIFPALSAMRVFKNFKAVVICSAVVSVFCAVFGILISMLLSTPVGATIVLTDTAVFFLFYLVSLILRRK
jgi:zinc transport system permease protein